MINDYNECQIDYRKRCKGRIQRQLEINESPDRLDHRAMGGGGGGRRVKLDCIKAVLGGRIQRRGETCYSFQYGVEGYGINN